MFNEIYEDYKKQQTKSIKNFLPIKESDKKINGIDPKNLDLNEIFEKLNLIDKEINTLQIIENFYEELFKDGIILGILDGKIRLIKSLKENRYELDEIKQMNIEEITNFTLTPKTADSIAEQFKINILEYGEW